MSTFSMSDQYLFLGLKRSLTGKVSCIFCKCRGLNDREQGVVRMPHDPECVVMKLYGARKSLVDNGE